MATVRQRTGGREADRLPRLGWALYDGSCGICERLILGWKRTLNKHGFEVVPLQEPWVGERLRLDSEALREDFRLLLTDGRHYYGAQAYRELLRRIPWLYPAYILVSAPVLRLFFDAAYRWFAKNRFRFSESCGVRPHLKPQR